MTYVTSAKGVKHANAERRHITDQKLPTGHVPVQRPFGTISVDLVESKAESVSAAGVKYKYVLTKMDCLTRFAILTPTPNKSARVATQSLIAL